MKKKMSPKKFGGIFITITAILLILCFVVSGVMSYWSTVMDAVFGSGKISVTPAIGTENWNTDYYRLNALGWSFYYPSLGGSGSGAVGSNDLVSPTEAFAAAKIDVNKKIADYYYSWSNAHYSDWQISKANGYYTDDDTNTAPQRPTVGKTYDAAWDVPELNAEEIEEAVLAKAKEFHGIDGRIIVIVNSNNPLELTKLEDDPLVDAIMYVGGPGKAGFYGIADVISGAVNPSGRTADLYAADLLTLPVMQNFGSRVYYNANGSFDNMYDTKIAYNTYDGTSKERPIMFVGYEEGIYMGYRFFETAAADDLRQEYNRQFAVKHDYCVSLYPVSRLTTFLSGFPVR